MKKKTNSSPKINNRTSQRDKWISQISEIVAMPFFRLDYILNMDYEALNKEIAKMQNSKTGIKNYVNFLKYEKDKRAQAAVDSRVFFPRDDEYDLLIEEFRNRVKFLIQLTDDEVNVLNVISAIDAYVAAVKHLILNLNSEDINTFIHFDQSLSLTPAILAKDKFNNEDKLKIIEKLEDIIEEAEIKRSGIHSNQVNDYILLVTYLLAFYKFYCYQFFIGPSIRIINNLFFIPQWMGTLYLDVNGHIKNSFSLLCLHLSFNLFNWDKKLQTQIGISYKTYENLRYILDDTLELLKKRNTSFYIPIYQWFISRIDSDITQYYANNTQLEYYYLHDIDRIKILSCCEKFANYRYPVTIESVVQFLMQFQRQDVESVIRILDAIDFLEFWQLAERLEDAIKQIKKRNGDLAICPLGPVSGSTSLMQYYMAHSGLKGVSFFDNVTEAIRKSDKSSVICFIDDCALTGIQSNGILQTLMGKTKPVNNEMLVLPDNHRKKILGRKVGMALSIVSDTALEGLKASFNSLNLVDTYITFGSMTLEKEKTFSSASRVSWRDSNERKRMSLIFQKIGMRLLEAKAKEMNWSQKEHRRHSLGYGDFQRLLVFPYSVPKPTLIALWAEIKNYSSPWKPLFPLAVQDDIYYPVQ